MACLKWFLMCATLATVSGGYLGAIHENLLPTGKQLCNVIFALKIGLFVKKYLTTASDAQFVGSEFCLLSIGFAVGFR